MTALVSGGQVFLQISISMYRLLTKHIFYCLLHTTVFHLKHAKYRHDFPSPNLSNVLAVVRSVLRTYNADRVGNCKAYYEGAFSDVHVFQAKQDF